MKKHQIITLIIAPLFFILGLFVCYEWIGKPTINQNNTFQAGWEAAKKRVAASGFMPPIVKEKTLYGEVKEVGDKQISIKVQPFEPLADVDLDERIVNIDVDTKFYFLEMKHEEEREAIINEMQKSIQETKNPTSTAETPSTNAPASFFNKTAASFSDIKAGGRITVVAAADDVRETKSFIAAEILIQPMVCENPTCQITVH